MRIGVHLLQGVLIAILGAIMLITKRVSPTGGWTVMVFGFIGLIGKLYDHHLEQKRQRCQGD